MNMKSLCPAGEILWTTYYKNGEPKYIITSKIGSREFYYLYPIAKPKVLDAETIRIMTRDYQLGLWGDDFADLGLK